MTTQRPISYAAGPGHTRSFRDSAQAFREGRETPREFLERFIDRIEASEDDIHAFVTLTIDSARAAADAATQRYRDGTPASPIDGLPLGLKDIIQTAGVPTQAGSPIYDGWIPERDSPVTAALKRAGATILGKTATTEFAYGSITPARNPYDRERTPGTSSSGSAAAVGDAMLPAAIGTQLMSSVMRPASYCAHVGVKPTYGAIRQDAIHPFSPSGEHVGVHANALEDAWQLLQTLATEAGPVPGSRGLTGPVELPARNAPKRLMRMYTPGWEMAHVSVREAFEDALSRLSNAGVDIVEPGSTPALQALEDDFARADGCVAEVAAFEMRWPFFEYEREGHQFHGRIERLLERAHAITLEDYNTALAWKDGFRDRYVATAQDIDGVIGLTAPEVAPLGLENLGNPLMCSPASCMGAPAITLPALSADGLPLGLQLIGYHNRDADLFAMANWVDDALVR
ncbi:MAG: amidase [Rhodospirillaceae bacterium]|nr:amidase [Rhodospirillaceae bacterium]MBT6537577.1 amidase [Rhodospirillaceae bacterium]